MWKKLDKKFDLESLFYSMLHTQSKKRQNFSFGLWLCRLGLLEILWCGNHNIN